MSDISMKLQSLSGKLPSEFARQPRSLFEVERWKATEFRQFLLYTGPVVLKGVVTDTMYDHFLCLTVSMSILLTSDQHRRLAYLEYAQQLINYFVDKSIEIYSETFLVYNVHCLKHLPEDARTEFFSRTPSDSTLINIAYIRNFQSEVRKVIKQKEIIRKVACVKYHQSYVLFPRLHGPKVDH